MLQKKSKSVSVKIAWKNAWSYPAFRTQALVSLIAVLSFTIVFNRFFDFVEARQGALLNDYVLNILPSYNVSWIVFFFLYSGIIFGIYYHLSHPKTIIIIFH